MARVRVGVDGRSLRAPLAGIGRYTLGLVRALAGAGVEVRVMMAPRVSCRHPCYPAV